MFHNTTITDTVTVTIVTIVCHHYEMLKLASNTVKRNLAHEMNQW